MIKTQDRDLCNGCGACYNACPKKCISMEPDSEGFLYPVIDEQECINCNKCESVCQIYHSRDVKVTYDEPLVYACHNNIPQDRIESSSGGIAHVLAKYIIEKGGVVYGAAYDENMYVSHHKIEADIDCDRIRK